MNKKVTILIASFCIQFLLVSQAGAQPLSEDLKENYLKIFTPYHTIKSVSAYKVEEVNPVSQSSANMNYRRQLTEDEIDLMAKIVFAESKGEPFIGKIGVASVILNRLDHPKFPKSINDVIYQKNAFSCVDGSHTNIEPDTETYEAVYEALKGNDPTNNAVFFYNPNTASSKWMKNTSKLKTTPIGNHVFFR